MSHIEKKKAVKDWITFVIIFGILLVPYSTGRGTIWVAENYFSLRPVTHSILGYWGVGLLTCVGIAFVVAMIALLRKLVDNIEL